MAEAPRLVIDASAVLAGLLSLPDEPFTRRADNVLEDYRLGRVTLVGPAHFPFEVGHGLRRAVIRGRISLDRGGQMFEQFTRLSIPSLRSDSLLLDAWDFYGRLGSSFYDAGYLALAAAISCPLLHADAKLRLTLAGRFPHELWIEDYASPSETR